MIGNDIVNYFLDMYLLKSELSSVTQMRDTLIIEKLDTGNKVLYCPSNSSSLMKLGKGVYNKELFSVLGTLSISIATCFLNYKYIYK